jgi:hypothetical protein
MTPMTFYKGSKKGRATRNQKVVMPILMPALPRTLAIIDQVLALLEEEDDRCDPVGEQPKAITRARPLQE